MQSERRTFESAAEYQVGWITALPLERAAAIALLDERHNTPLTFVQSNNDTNSYTFGRIAEHNVVIAGLPAGIYGVVSATRTALGLVASFPHIRIGLLVGIGAAIPESKVDIRLGDVVVSQPKGTSGGVLQYDFRKATKTGGWEMIGTLALPPIALLAALGNLQAEHSLEDSQMTSILGNAYKKNSKFADGFGHPGTGQDVLIQGSSEEHPKGTMESRSDRPDNRPHIHYGAIASGATLVKNAKVRGEIFSSMPQPCLCLEMEAAGLQNDFPCLVIRGICDYADEQKNDVWQPYASATAASFAKELLMYLPRKEVDNTQSISATIKPLEKEIQSLKENIASTKQDGEDEKVLTILRALHTCPYAERKDRNFKRLEGTCNWFTNHPLFTRWRETNDIPILFCSADPGCGKSVLARHLIDNVLPGPDKIVCYFFFKDDFIDQRTSANAVCALLRQMLLRAPGLATKNIFKDSEELSPKNILEAYARDGDNYIKSFRKLWTAFIEVCNQSKDSEIICVLDALDECQKTDRKEMIQALQDVTKCRGNLRLKILVTSRRYHDIDQEFSAAKIRESVLHLDGDTEHEKKIISEEIDVVLKHRINTLMVKKDLTLEDRDFLVTELTSTPQRTYLWAHLTLKVIEETPGFTRGRVKEVCVKVPSSIDEAYDRILCFSTDKIKARTLLSIVVAAERPVTVTEMSLLLALNQRTTNFEELVDDIEPDRTFRITVRQLCGLFVVVVDSRIYLLHQTAREFLVAREVVVDSPSQRVMEVTTDKESDHLQLHWKQSLSLPQAHRQITQKCLWLIFLKELAGAYDCLRTYAGDYWVLHFRKSDFTSTEDIVELALELCSPLRNFGLLQGDDSSKTASSCRSDHGLEHDDGSDSETESRTENKTKAVKSDHSELIRKKLMVLQSLGNGFSALMISAYLGLYAVVEHLLCRKQAHHLTSTARFMALKCAVMGGSKEVAVLLLSHGTRPDISSYGWNILQIATQHFALKKKISFHQNKSEFEYRYRSFSCLHEAVALNQESLVKILLDAGASTESTDPLGRTPLILAAEQGYYNIIKHLLQYSARINVRDYDSYTPVEYFIRRDRHDEYECQVIDRLWHHKKIFTGGRCVTEFKGSKVNFMNSMLDQAISRCCLHCSSFLLQKGAKINNASVWERPVGLDWQCTPLMKAVEMTHMTTSMVRFLIDNGAKLDIKDFKGASAIHYVRNKEVLEVLLDRGADINATTSDGQTLLMKLIQLNKDHYKFETVLSLVQATLKHGADVRLKDHDQRSALHYASWGANEEESQYFQSQRTSNKLLAVLQEYWLSFSELDVAISEGTDFLGDSSRWLSQTPLDTVTDKNFYNTPFQPGVFPESPGPMILQV